VVAQLGLGRARRFRGSFNRPNLVYAVEPKRDGDRQLLELLARHREDTGIVYCMARVETERVAALIQQHGFAAAPYHAGMSSEGRGQRQEAFACGQLRVIVATIAFGMGIDKADVRFVVHYDAPRSLEGYYQESGRAGRDGALSECLLLYSAGDVGRMEYFVAQKPAAEQSVAREQLRKVRDYAEGQVCRRRFLLAYFDETLEQAPSPCCDLCRHPAQIEDYTMPAQMLMSCAMRTGQRFGSAHLIAVLRGARSERLLRLGHDKLSTYGIGRDRSEDEWRHIARQLEIGGYVKRDAEGNGLVVTETGSAVLFRGQQVLLPALPGSRSRRGNRSSDQAAEGVKAGGTIAAGRTDAQEDAKEVVLDAPAARKVTPTIERTIALFNGRRTLDQVALDRGLALATIEDHLATAVEAGRIEIEALVPAERRAAIGAALAVVGADLLRPVFDHLKGEYSFGEIKLVRAALRRSTLRSLQD
jgi:ATP-dependent DNA helicase RecQ